MALPRRITDFLTHSRLFITCCAAMMTWHTSTLFPDRHQVSAVIWFNAAATLLTYAIHAMMGMSSDSPSLRDGWVRRHRLAMACMAMAATVGIVHFLPMTGIPLSVLCIPATTTAIYLFAGELSPLARRLTGYVKTFLLAFTWTWVTALMPLLSSDGPLTAPQMQFTLNRFFLVYAICLLFDRRDREADLHMGMQTLPARISERNFTGVFRATLLCFFATLLAWYLHDRNLPVFLILFMPGFILAWVGPAAGRNRGEPFYYLFLDGSMMLPAVLHFLFIH